MDDYGTESMEALVEELEDFEESDIDEAAGRGHRRRPRPHTASGRNAYSPRPQANYVTQDQLRTSLEKVSEQIKANSTAIQTVNNRVEAVAADQAKQADAIRKEMAERRKQDDSQRRDVNQKLQLLTLLPFISKPATKEIRTRVSGEDQDRTVKVLVEDDDTFSQLLPLLLIGGLGGSGLGGSGSDGSSDSSMPLLLLLALGKRD
jgi:hypothetical protein